VRNAEHGRASAPALLLCSERSGSNLLRCMLDAHPRVYAPNTMALGPLWECYARAKAPPRPQHWRALLAEATRRINESTFYTGVGVSEEELVRHVPEHDAASLYLHAYRKGMRAIGADRIVIKEHHAWRIAPLVFDCFPDARVVIQVRDPRDHAASCKKLGKLYAAYHGSVPRAARMWRREQVAALRLRARYGGARVHIHRYEDLVRDPSRELRDICRFLDLEWDEAMLDFHVLQADHRRSAGHYLDNMWANLDRPVGAHGVGRWRSTLSRHEVRAVERETGDVCTALGYDSDFSERVRAKVDGRAYRATAGLRYASVTAGLWVAWMVASRGSRVPRAVVLGDAIRGHRPYERFRDRHAYQL
jgi:hypothetical protein